MSSSIHASILWGTHLYNTSIGNLGGASGLASDCARDRDAPGVCGVNASCHSCVCVCVWREAGTSAVGHATCWPRDFETHALLLVTAEFSKSNASAVVGDARELASTQHTATTPQPPTPAAQHTTSP